MTTSPARHRRSTLCLVAAVALSAWLPSPAFPQSERAPKPPTPATPAPASSKPTASSSTTGKAEGLKVVSKEKATAAGSQFLRPPGAGRYDDPPDWRDVPPWRQTSFFGIKARGQFFVYVVDCSGSMIDEDRLARAKEELRRSVRGLQEPQRFQVIFYNDQPIAMPGGLPRSADLLSKNQFLAWLRLIEPDGGTDPRSAMGMALALRPDAVFLLSDGEYPAGAADAITAKNSRKIPIHCVDLSGGTGGDQLQQIARESGGHYISRPWAGD
jgi:hypothetical protein